MRPSFPQVVDSSMLAAFRACPQKFYQSQMEHWKPKGESIHLHAGKAFAQGLERARLSYFERDFDAETSVAHGLKALMEAYGNFEAPEGSAKTLERMCGALEFYFSEWPLTSPVVPHVMPSGKRAIEFSFAEPLEYLHPESHEPIIYSGRTDQIVDFAEGVYIEDDKTATQLGESWTRQWELRSQFTGYSWAARKAGIKTNGVLVRGVSILKTKYGAAEAITYREQWEIDRWYEQVIRDLKRMERSWEDGHWDFNLDEACSAWGGCQFTQVCKSIPSESQTWLKMYFERRVWDPLERTETLVEEAA